MRDNLPFVETSTLTRDYHDPYDEIRDDFM